MILRHMLRLEQEGCQLKQHCLHSVSSAPTCFLIMLTDEALQDIKADHIPKQVRMAKRWEVLRWKTDAGRSEGVVFGQIHHQMKDTARQRTVAGSKVHMPPKWLSRIHGSSSYQRQRLRLQLLEVFGNPPQGGSMAGCAQRHGKVALLDFDVTQTGESWSQCVKKLNLRFGESHPSTRFHSERIELDWIVCVETFVAAWPAPPPTQRPQLDTLFWFQQRCLLKVSV